MEVARGQGRRWKEVAWRKCAEAPGSEGLVGGVVASLGRSLQEVGHDLLWGAHPHFLPKQQWRRIESLEVRPRSLQDWIPQAWRVQCQPGFLQRGGSSER